MGASLYTFFLSLIIDIRQGGREGGGGGGGEEDF